MPHQNLRLYFHKWLNGPLGKTVRKSYKSYFLKTRYVHLEFPKCGRTWTRLMIYRAESIAYNLPQENTLNSVFYPKYNLPTLGYTHGIPHDSPLKDNGKLFFRASGEPIRGVVIQVRHPIAVMRSWYLQCIHRENLFTGNIEDFVRNENLGISRYIDFLEFYITKLRMSGRLTHHILKYEDLQSDTAKQLASVLDFVNIQLSQRQIEEIANEFSFNNMKQLIKYSPYDKIPWLQPSDKSKDSAKIRSGGKENYKKELGENSFNYIKEAVLRSNICAELGYHDFSNYE